MKNLLSKLTVLSATAAVTAALAVAVFSHPALAQEKIVEQPFSFRFSYHRADLETPEGADRLLKRLRTAVTTHCRNTEFILVNPGEAIEQCVSNTMNATVARISSPMLAQRLQAELNG